MSPQEYLENFYQSFRDRGLVMKPEYGEIAGPDLIWLDDEYLQSEPKIAIIGKEQLGWDYSYSEFISQWDIKSAISVYRRFDFGKQYYSSPFWQFFHQIRDCAFPQEPNARKKVLWTNLLKFVATDTTPIFKKPYAEPVYDIQKDLLVTELNIAKPDICLFVTGPNYDFILERYYPKIKFKELGLPVRQFAKLIHPQLPLRSYRMYHPNYLNWDRKGRWEMTFQILARELSWPTNSLQTASLSGRA